MRPAEVANTKRQELSEARKLEAGRASMIPIISPLITEPTTRPRVASGARCAASGTMICAPADPRPIAKAQARKTLGELARAAEATATALSATQTTTSFRFSRRSPSGTRKTSPAP